MPESAPLTLLESLVKGCCVSLLSTYGLYLRVQDRGQVGFCTGFITKWLKQDLVATESFVSSCILSIS